MNVALAPETCAQLALNWDGGDVKEITAGVRPEQILLADKGEEGAAGRRRGDRSHGFKPSMST